MSQQAGDTQQPHRSSSLVTWIGLASLAALVFVFVLLKPNFPNLGLPKGADHPAVGNPLPSFNLQPLTGDSRPVELSQLRGKVVLINFWGTWCPPCQEELPHIAKLAKRFSSEPDFQLLAVSCGSGGDSEIGSLREDTASYLEAVGLQIPTYADIGGWARQTILMVANLEDFFFPTTVVLDGDGIIRGLWTGYRAGFEREMEQVVEKLLEDKAKTPGAA